MREDITKRIGALNDELAIRQESIDPLKGRLKSQITSFNPIWTGEGADSSAPKVFPP